jgi:DNA gyrase subunit A
MRLPEDEDIWKDLDIMFATTSGKVRRNNLSDFKNIRSNGLIAMKLEGQEELVSVKICTDEEDVLLASRNGKAIRFPVTDVRVFSGRTSTGVRGIKLSKDDKVIGMSIIKKNDDGGSQEALLCVSEKGLGKRTYTSEYRTASRGGQGVINMNITSKTGKVVATFPVTEDHQVMLISDQGQMIRIPVHNIRYTGRSAQGVSLFKVSKSEKVVSVAWLIEDDEEEAIEQSESNPS